MDPQLRPAGYQLVPLTKLLLNPLRAVLIADGVGVGKTISAAYILDHFSSQRQGPCLVVCPSSLVDKWRLELKSKFRKNARTIRSAEEFETTVIELQQESSSEIYISSYSFLNKLETTGPFPVLIIDEIHNFRNPETQLWRAAHDLANRGKWIAGLSATPINNAISDLGAEFSVLMPNFDPIVVAALVEDIWQGNEFPLLEPYLTRFTKEQLGIHFAVRHVSQVAVTLPKSYGDHVRKVIAARRGREQRPDSYPMDSITLFREATSSPLAFEISTEERTSLSPDPKLSALLEILEQQPAQVLVFCQFIATVDYIEAAVEGRDVFKLTGEVPVADREALIEDFRRSQSAVLVLTQVGSEGLDFQFCNVVINYDLHWNPMVLEQRIGRCDRVGQEKDVVEVFNLRVTDSIDDRVIRIVGRKLALLVGTPLDQKPIVAQGNQLFDRETLSQETRRAKDLMRVLELVSPLMTKDAAILPYIDETYARAGGTMAASPTDWISSGPKADAWVDSIILSAGRFSQRMQKLQSYVS